MVSREIMKIEDLKEEYDKLQLKYGELELDPIYSGGCVENPDICFVFMNPTGKNIASDKSWKGRKSKIYNLDMIIAVGYRVNSKKATQFIIWATKVLKEYLITGVVMDDERLKNLNYI